MGGNKRSAALVLMGLALILVGFACAPAQVQQAPPPTPTALFTFDPILVSPLPVVAGQPVTLSMAIGNTGTVAGTYNAELYINGSTVDNETISIAPGASGKAVFETSINTPGLATIKIGPQTLQLSVMENRVPLTLKLDTGQVDGCDVLVGNTSNAGSAVQSPDSYMIKFTAPAGGATINTLEVFGYIKSSTYDYNNSNIWGPGTWVYGWDIASYEPVNPQFTINIYDSHRASLYTGSFSRTMFTNIPGWININITPTNVNGDFYIELRPYNLPTLNTGGYGTRDTWGAYVMHTWYDQICIGYEKIIDVQSWVSYQGSIMPSRYLTYNWLIRADGYQTQ